MKKDIFKNNSIINKGILKIDSYMEKNNTQKMRFNFYVLCFFILVVINPVNIFVIKNEILATVNIFLDFWFLILFSLMGWFSTDLYHSSLVIYDKSLELKDWKCTLKRIIKYSSIGYLKTIVVVNFLNSIIFSTQVIYFFEEEYKFIAEGSIVMIDLLLIPSFVKLFETIIKNREILRNVLRHAFVRQSVTMEDLFENYEFSKNFVFLNFDNYFLKSKHNIFFITGNNYSLDEKDMVKKLNHEIVDIYKELWYFHVKIIQEYHKLKTKKQKRKCLNILLYYFMIWVNFFDF
ncbi:hypothetical protein [Spiroplasma endosymbiont of Aspidapion aeneum]|uniref:hypothetical protein n=1 Tax=Spiroplasma endosymbiont of Aspidapion aeneum TaxID=3066276 RepID=UPI00313AE8CF